MSITVKIDEIEDGMVTAVTLTNKFGQTIFPAGKEISREHIKMLRTWNISLVEIKSDDDDEVIELTEDILFLAKEYLSGKMLWEPRNEIEEDLLQIGIEHRGRKILKNQRGI